MNPDYNKIFTQSSCLTNTEIHNYVSGDLSAKDKRRIEIHITDCEMCNDELEGLMNMKNVYDLPIIISAINTEIDSVLEKERLNIASSDSKKYNLKRILSVAASIALLITIGFIINDFSDKNSENLAQAEVTEERFIEEAKIIDETETAEFEESIDENSPDERVVLAEKTLKITEDRSLSTKQIVSAEISESESDKDEEIQFDDIEEIVVEDSGTDKLIPSVVDNLSTSRKKELAKSDSEISDVSADESEEIKSFIGVTSRNISTKKSKESPSTGVNYLSLRNSGLLSYNIKSYKEAAIDFDNYLTYKPEDYEIVYKSGMSYYYQKNYTSAISRYNKIISGDINKYVEDALWYKSMALINQGKEEEALILLHQIVFTNGKYQKRALDAINQIENK